MSILAINLKMYYKRLGMVLMLVFMLLMGAFVVLTPLIKNGGGAILGVLLWVFIVGLMFGGSQIEILIKPFVYCLPGHRSIPKKVLYMFGVIVSAFPFLGYLLMHVMHDGQSGAGLVLPFVVLCVCWSFYLLGVWMVFKWKGATGVWGFIGFISFSLMMEETNAACEQFLIDYWVIFVAAAVVITFLVNRVLSNKDLARRLCAQRWLGMFAGFNQAKLKEAQRQRFIKQAEDNKLGVNLSLKLESFFLPKISSNSTGPIQKHIWSLLYRSYDVFVSVRGWKFLLRWMLLLICYFCYMPRIGSLFVYIFPMFGVIWMDTGIFSKMMIFGGRRERFWSAVVLVVTSVLNITLVLVLACLVSQLIAPIMPEVTLSEHSFSFTPLNPYFALINLVTLPFAIGLGALFNKNLFMGRILVVVIIMTMVQMVSFSVVIRKQGIEISPWVIAVVGLASWGFMVGMFRWICAKWSLVSN